MNDLINQLYTGLFSHPLYPLIAASVLGLLIGASVARLLTLAGARRVNGALQAHVQELQRQGAQLVEERDSARLLGERQRELADEAERRADAAEAQQDALSVHARLQAQRLQGLEAEVKASEERLVCLQGELAQRRHRVTQGASPAPRVAKDAEARADGVPVLHKRVDGEKASTARPLIDEELDSPRPADFLVPASIDALEFELAEDSDDHDRRD